jgi:hypothetical protein
MRLENKDELVNTTNIYIQGERKKIMWMMTDETLSHGS